LQAGAFHKCARKGDKRPLQQRRVASVLQIEQVAHLPIQPLIGKGIGAELVAQKVADDLFGVGNGVQHQNSAPCGDSFSLVARTSGAPSAGSGSGSGTMRRISSAWAAHSCQERSTSSLSCQSYKRGPRREATGWY